MSRRSRRRGGAAPVTTDESLWRLSSGELMAAGPGVGPCDWADPFVAGPDLKPTEGPKRSRAESRSRAWRPLRAAPTLRHRWRRTL
ncbi:hypothetical protein NDU88_003638 [Pleurodeles waltl]|uniref:Uncharacterized protein n=1 Tax=Pleurodeles waltl TaxID=8319 RepID=A0AAV7KZJ5_PLEWA|nr:hypothetical protein NDU88_003638 [Pleurodeles waltl]